MTCIPSGTLGSISPEKLDASEAEPTPLSEEDLDLLVRYSLLPTDVVKEAWAVFNHYRVVECHRVHQRRRVVMGHSPVKPTVSMAVRPFPAVEKGADAFSAVPGTGSEEVVLNENGSGAASGERALVKTEEWAPASSQGGLVGEDSVCGRHEEVEVAVLGVEGLRQFLEDTGTPMPTLEVAALLRALSEPPVDYVLYRRAMEGELAAAEATAVSSKEESVAAAQRKRKSPHSEQLKCNKNNAVGRSQRSNNNAKLLSILVDDHVDLLGKHRNLGRGTITFPLFLFILSGAGLEKNLPSDNRESEINTLFHMLDVDGDGVVSAEDIRELLEERCSLEDTLYQDRDIQCLRGMSIIELKAALQECDVDEDGEMKLNDLRSVLGL